jgi:hypothetical protein
MRFAQIFWGLLLVLLDFRINRVDLFPDFLGYILVAIGCRELANVSRHFATANTFAWVSVGLALLGFLLSRGVAQVFGLVALAVDCAMMWFLLGGIMELALARQRADLAQRASNRRIAYVVIMCLGTFAGMAAQGSRSDSEILGVLLILCIFPLLFMILHLIHRAKHELAGY